MPRFVGGNEKAMFVLKCKMCGGDLDLIDGTNMAVCQYCGTKQILSEVPAVPADSGRRGTRDIAGFPDQWDVVLVDHGPRLIEVIRAIREVTGAGLAKAKSMAEELPCTIKAAAMPKEAIKIKKLLEAAGAQVRLE